MRCTTALLSPRFSKLPNHLFGLLSPTSSKYRNWDRTNAIHFLNPGNLELPRWTEPLGPGSRKTRSLVRVRTLDANRGYADWSEDFKNEHKIVLALVNTKRAYDRSHRFNFKGLREGYDIRMQLENPGTRKLVESVKVLEREDAQRWQDVQLADPEDWKDDGDEWAENGWFKMCYSEQEWRELYGREE